MRVYKEKISHFDIENVDFEVKFMGVRIHNIIYEVPVFVASFLFFGPFAAIGAVLPIHLLVYVIEKRYENGYPLTFSPQIQKCLARFPFLKKALSLPRIETPSQLYRR